MKMNGKQSFSIRNITQTYQSTLCCDKSEKELNKLPRFSVGGIELSCKIKNLLRRNLSETTMNY